MLQRRTATIATACAVLAGAAVAHGPAPASTGKASVPAEASAGGNGTAAGQSRDHVPGEVILGLESGGEHVVRLPAGLGVPRAKSMLERLPAIRYANRNWRARAAIPPLDKGSSGLPGGWREEQWNFLGKPGGIRAIGAWHRLVRDGRPGARDVRVAVVDTGIAYANWGHPPGFRASPGFTASTSIGPGRDFVDDGLPLDRNGHGTHIAGTIAEQVTVGEPAANDEPDYLTGLAYNATLMPVRVLDEHGEGTAAVVAQGMRWATDNGAEVINVSLQLPARVRRCSQVRTICRAVRHARRNGALVVAAAGNAVGAPHRVLFPAAAPGAMAVGASTESGCLAAYSHHGRQLDLIAPGGGQARGAVARPRCRDDRAPIRQVSFKCFHPGIFCAGDYRTFTIVPSHGTSMAAAHVSGVAAMLRAARAAGRDPAPQRLERRLRCSARPLGRPRFHGAGLLDATGATRKRPPARCTR
jgi:serine protease